MVGCVAGRMERFQGPVGARNLLAVGKQYIWHKGTVDAGLDLMISRSIRAAGAMGPECKHRRSAALSQ